MSAKRAGGPLSGSSDEEDEEKGRCNGASIPQEEAVQLETADTSNEETERTPCEVANQPKTQRPSLITEAAPAPDSGTAVVLEETKKIRRPKLKKKKPASGFHQCEELLHTQPAPPKTPKQKRDYLPMRMRALPQSFWQQPNHPHNVSPGTLCHRLLPPLCVKDNGLDDEIDTFRPVSPPTEKETRDKEKIRSSRAEPKMTIVNPDLLHKLFEQVEDKRPSVGNVPLAPVHTHSRRGRPKRILSSSKTQLVGGDPHLVETVTSKLFPHLSIDVGRSTSSGTGAIGAPNVSVQLITIHEGDKCVTLPSLCVEQNYSQMLSELASHI